MNGEAGKGDTYRTVNREKYDEGYTRIFGYEPPIQTWSLCSKCNRGGVNYRNPRCPRCGHDNYKKNGAE